MPDRQPSWAIVADYAIRLEVAEKASAEQHRWWLTFVALLPYAVHVEKPAINIPLQRTAPDGEVALWPPAVIRDAAPSRFLDSRNSPTP